MCERERVRLRMQPGVVPFPRPVRGRGIAGAETGELNVADERVIPALPELARPSV